MNNIKAFNRHLAKTPLIALMPAFAIRCKLTCAFTHHRSNKAHQAANMAADKPQQEASTSTAKVAQEANKGEEDAKKTLPQLGALEEDDEFEEVSSDRTAGPA